MYVCGGEGRVEEWLCSCECYSFAGEEWESVPSLGVGVGVRGASVVAVGGQWVFIIGGMETQGVCRLVVVCSAWTLLAQWVAVVVSGSGKKWPQCPVGDVRPVQWPGVQVVLVPLSSLGDGLLVYG